LHKADVKLMHKYTSVGKVPQAEAMGYSAASVDSLECGGHPGEDDVPNSRKKAINLTIDGFYILAEWTGLEPATPGVTGRYSNQLNYHSW
jgi:hypothetical protein